MLFVCCHTILLSQAAVSRQTSIFRQYLVVYFVFLHENKMKRSINKNELNYKLVFDYGTVQI